MRSDRASAAASLVRVVVDDGNGSGVVLSDRRVLTCEHMVRGRDEVQVRGRIEDEDDGSYIFVEAPARVVRVNRRRDLALLEVDPDVTFEIPPMELAKQEPNLYEPVMLAACANDLFGIVVDGLLQACDGSADDKDLAHDYVVSGLTVHGSSGGAVVDDDGCLVGLLTGVIKDEEKDVHLLGYAVPLPAIRRFLSGRKKTCRPLRAVPLTSAAEDVPACHVFEAKWEPARHEGDTGCELDECITCGKDADDPIHG